LSPRELGKVLPTVLLLSLVLMLASATGANGVSTSGLSPLAQDGATPQQQATVGTQLSLIPVSFRSSESQWSSPHAGSAEAPAPDAVVSSITSVVCETNPVWVTLSTTCTVTVTGTANENPTGNITLSASSTNGGAVTISMPTRTVGCPCYFGVVGTSVGNVTITATYSGDKNYVGSSGIFMLSVVPILTTTYVDCSFSTFQVGQSVLCIAKVSPSANSSATGSITFTQVGTSDPAGVVTLSLGTCNLSNGACEFRATGASPGTGKIVGSYSGDRTHAESSGTQPFTVIQAKTMITSTCTAQLTVGQSGKCTVVVKSSPNSPPLTGDTVSFTQTSTDGGSVKLASASCTLKNAPYTCEVSFTAVSAGTVTIAARFNGDKYNAPDLSIPTVKIVQAGCEGPDDTAASFSTSCSAPVPEFGAPAVLVAALGLALLSCLRAIRGRRVARIA
jgi:large repetitive protein